MAADFVNRRMELDALHGWWERRGSMLAIVWGRRRVGKSTLLKEFARPLRCVFHTGIGRPLQDELATLSTETAAIVDSDFRDLELQPFTSWSDALSFLAQAAQHEPLLLVLDEFHELVAVVNELPSIMRADWDRLSGHTQLRILLCGSAVRAMESMQEQREPLYGRFSLSLLVHPFRPHEAALMLPNLSPADRALVWGILGGMPLYLSWWDQAKSVTDNLRTLACSPGAPLLREGELIMATEAGASNLAHQVLYAVASKKTRFGEIRDAVKTDPTRVLERLVSLRLVERLVPVTDTDSAASRGIYRIADNFLIFWLDVVNNQRSAIDTGMVDSVLPVIEASIDDHMGLRWGGGLSQPHSQAGPGWPVG
ncbi:MAG TPA: ATP-binding protein [Chloroflexota bacterium]|jgi:AAA+ ATPase superfamily predicted ATPase